jgi:hypothetical protein
MMHTFIHPTKTGGVTLGTYLATYHKSHVSKTLDHATTCTRTNNPIIVVREPRDRFGSMYNFWKYGSDFELCQKDTPESESLAEFIEYVKCQDPKLTTKYTGPLHFAPQSHWIPRDTWSSAIVIKYVPDLSTILDPLLQYLGAKPVRAGYPWPHCERKNTTRVKEPVDLSGPDLEWFLDYFKEDLELWDAVNTEPHLFKHVIKF